MASFGEVLKRERELRQITLREVAEATKINLRYLDALERDDFRHLPGGVFNKGFVRAYSQHIGIDADSMVDAYLAEEREQDARNQAQTTESHRRAVPAEDFGDAPAAPLRLVLFGIGLVVAILVLAVLGFLYWRGILDPARWLRGKPRTDAPQTQLSSPRPVPGAPASGSVAGGQGFDAGFAATVVLARATRGSVRCDDGEATAFDAVAVGGAVDLRCREYLEVRADDAGAVRVGLDGAAPAPVGADGAAVYGLRIRRTAVPSPSGGPS